MDRKIAGAVTQITQDYDINVPDSKLDIGKIIFKKGDIRIEDTKTSENQVVVTGLLMFRILYTEDGNSKGMNSFEGNQPFEEMVHMEGITVNDTVEVKWDMEDMTISIINSRKLNLQSVITLRLSAEKIVDEETTIDISSKEPLEYRKKPLNIAEICLCKKDIYRVREEVELPSNLPNVFRILWDSARVGGVEVKPMDEKLSIQGEVNLFILYEAEGEEGIMQWYETTVPFSGIIDCRDCKESCVADIDVMCVHKDVMLAQDLDGEDRVICADLTLELCIKLYEEKTVQILSDIYGVTKEVTPQIGRCHYKSLCMKNRGKCRGVGHMKPEHEGMRILQICHSEGNVKVDEIRVVENGLAVDGVVEVQILYITADDKVPFYNITGVVPFHHVLEAEGITEECLISVKVMLEQLTTTVTAGDEIEVKASLAIDAMVFHDKEEDIITDVTIKELDPKKLKSLPSMVGYFVGKNESLWQIGKEYYVPVSKIKEVNGLTSDEIKEGDKLLIVK